MLKNKTLISWSSGKDSALALYKLLQDPNYKIDKLLTTINTHYNRVTMHGLRNELLLSQARSIDIPLDTIELPMDPDMATYNNIMCEKLNTLKLEGFSYSVFGDIFLEDLKIYRENLFQSVGIDTVFPIWKMNSNKLLNEIIDLGFKTIVVAASAKYFDKSFLGTLIDREFLDKIPQDVDCCGENGEFHTFCYDGPFFKNAISFSKGNTIYKEYKNPDKDDNSTQSGFWYLDLLPN